MQTPLRKVRLVTIICESVLQDRIVGALKTLGIDGYTVQEARGAGRHGRRMGDIAGFNTNIELKTLMEPDLSDQLMSQLQEYQARYALVAFCQDVDALME